MKTKTKTPPPRLSADGSRAIAQLANGTGWSANAALAFIARAGWNALNGNSERTSAMRNVMANALDHHETETAMKQRLAVTARKLREAQQALCEITGGAE
jgi:hypothetical protein